MTAEKTTMAFGWRVYGLGVMALGMVCPAWGDFDLGQPVPKDFPDRTALAYAAAAFMLVAGTAVISMQSAKRPEESIRKYCPSPPSGPRTTDACASAFSHLSAR